MIMILTSIEIIMIIIFAIIAQPEYLVTQHLGI